MATALRRPIDRAAAISGPCLAIAKQDQRAMLAWLSPLLQRASQRAMLAWLSPLLGYRQAD